MFIKKVFAFMFLISFSTKGQLNHVLGVSLGSELSNPANTNPAYSNKDISLDYSIIWKAFSIETRQAFRYFDNFYDEPRSSSYLCIGVTTNKNRFFSFNFLIGSVYSFLLTEKDYQKPGYHYYFPQLDLCVKSGFNFALNKNRRSFISLEFLASNYRYTYDTGSFGEGSGLTSSGLISFKYFIKKKTNE